MLQTIPPMIRARMEHLERIDERDRIDGTPHMQRVRQITPEVGRFLALLAAAAPSGRYIEIGTSAGYSTLWLALACREVGRRITTFEVLEEKAEMARETFSEAAVWDVVDLVVGDARHYLDEYTNIGFCFLDAEKGHYQDCYNAVVPKLVSGGLLVADNAVSHRSALQSFLDRALADTRVDALIVPIGRGELVCRKV